MTVVTKRLSPAADREDMVAKGIAPDLIPNWDKNDVDSLWYLNARKFNEDRKVVYLSKLEQFGRSGLAARHAGVDHGTVLDHRKIDPDFDAACKEAESMYHEMMAASITRQGLVGQVDERYDSAGNVLSRRVTYEQQLRIRLLQRADPSYQDTSRQEVAVVGGAVVVPAPIDSVESWDDVVRRHTGASVNGAQRTLTDGERSEPLAITEGRVVKRTILEAKGEEVKEEVKDKEAE